MLTSAYDIINKISPFVLPAIMIAAGTVLSVVLIAYAVKLIRRQIKLYNSISLVELKSAKIHYWVFLGLTAFFIIYVIFQMADSQSPEVKLLFEKMNMERWQSNLTLVFLLLLLISAEFLLAVLTTAKSAVVDRGIYISLKYLDWYHVHDYIIDEEKCVVILTSNKDSFSTLSGTTPPLRVAKNDIAKLKFILNKNKNKFSGFSSDVIQEKNRDSDKTITKAK